MRTLIVTGVVTALLSVVCTALTEWMQPAVTIIPGFLHILQSHNAGIAYGMKLPAAVQTGVIVVAFILVAVFAIRSKRDPIADIGFGLILGGALGNILDRLPDGLVTDFLSIGTFPTFNLADAFISIGVGMLIVEELRKRKIDRR